METKTETPATAAPAATSVPATLTTYEDCLGLIGQMETESNPENIKGALVRLKTFFQNRVGRKQKKEAADGSAAVKQAMQARGFKKYEKKEVAGETVVNPFA